MTGQKSAAVSHPAPPRSLAVLNSVIELIASGFGPDDSDRDASVEAPSQPVHATLFHNWPDRKMNDFYGRQGYVVKVLNALNRYSAVTVVGMGGWGKTRLAIAVAGCIAGHPPADLYIPQAEPVLAHLRQCCGANMYYVDLTQCPQDSEDGVWGEISNQLGMAYKADAHAGVAAQVQATYERLFAARKALLVLDNAEHLRDQDMLARVVATLATKAKVLLTSRIPIAGAQSVELKEMERPNVRSSPDTWLNNEAVKLFAHRATLDLHPQPQQPTRQQADFYEAGYRNALRSLLTQDEHVRQIVRICCKLECIPLAIVLAASRASDYVQQTGDDPARWLAAMLKALEESLLEPLEMQPADIEREPTDERHQTMAKCIVWSYNLLAEASQALLRSLSIFRASWTLADMRLVCEGSPEAHESLEKAHLIVPDTQAGPESYTFFNTIREFAGGQFASKASASGVTKLEGRYVERFLGSLAERLSVAEDTVKLQKELPDIENALEIAASRNSLVFKTTRKQLAQQWEEAWQQNAEEAGKPNETQKLQRYFPVMDRLLAVAQRQNIPLPKRSPLHYLQRGREISKVLTNDLQINALFGAKNPDFTELHELETQTWLEEAKRTIVVLVNRAQAEPEKEPLMLVCFTCMYFISHDWWDAYIQDSGATGRKLLNQWKNLALCAGDTQQEGDTQPAGAALHDLLKTFDKNYPQKSDWEARALPAARAQWQRVYDALNKIQRMLLQSVGGENFDPASLSQPEQFLYGILMRYYGEASFHLHQHSLSSPFHREWEGHYSRSFAALEPTGKQANDSFFRFMWQWSLGDAAQRYELAGNALKAAALCEQVIADEHAECAGDVKRLDSELLANAYATLGGAAAREGRFDEAALYHSAAILLAYIYLLTERDTYAITFYTEHRARMRARARPLFQPTSGNRIMNALRTGRRISNSALEIAYERLYHFWKPYWSLNADAQHPPSLLPDSADSLQQAVSAMLPPLPDDEAQLNSDPSETLERIAAVLRNMAASEEWTNLVCDNAGLAADGKSAQTRPLARLADFIRWLDSATPSLLAQAYEDIHAEQVGETESPDAGEP